MFLRAIALRFKVTATLKIHPEIGAGLEIETQPQGGIGSDATLAQHDLIDAASRYANILRKPVLTNAQRLDELLL